MRKFLLAALASTTLFAGEVAFNQASANNYDVAYRNAKVKLDGKLDEKVWEGLGEISGSFHFPWEMREAPLTRFKAFHDNTNFYFSFKVYDKEVVAEKEWKGESTVDIEDRVELFFAQTTVDKPVDYKLIPYYATEVDPYGRAHDYKIDYYRKFDSEYNIEGAKNAAKIDKDGYTVEGMIPLTTLNALKLINADKIMRTGVFRAEFSKDKNGEIIYGWISWVNPKTPVPDFHVDSAFGEFRFLELK